MARLPTCQFPGGQARGLTPDPRNSWIPRPGEGIFLVMKGFSNPQTKHDRSRDASREYPRNDREYAPCETQ